MKKLAVIGLGYVGLPLAVAFGRKLETIGFDINSVRVNQLRSGRDVTNELSSEEVLSSRYLTFTNELSDLSSADIFIVTVPTPVDQNKKPDFTPLLDACNLIGKVMRPGSIIIFESTVFPGATEEICVPALEAASNLQANIGFFYGYSPERINPGDKQKKLSDIIKVTSGSTEAVSIEIDALYSQIIHAGTWRASSIKVAEASKIIENTQRDINIALMNELSKICAKLDIDTLEVLDAASTKWNFHKFTPGLVGGHCIGVDPYYLAYKAIELGVEPNLILGGRGLNDSMVEYVQQNLYRLLIQNKLNMHLNPIMVMGIGFKENCPDIRNSKAVELVELIKGDGIQVDVFDPICEYPNAMTSINVPFEKKYSAVIITNTSEFITEFGEQNIRHILVNYGIVIDLKGAFPKQFSDFRL